MNAAPKIAVLGGSSPFTAALFDALASSGDLPPHQLMLFGRNSAALAVVTRRAQCCLGPLGWSARSTTNRAEALDGATFVIHQIRYGGLDGRESGERLAERFGMPADETLGPAALQSAIQTASAVQETARSIASYCPNAWTINLTNPLSITTALFVGEGVKRCVGVCELPDATAQAVGDMIGVASSDLQWEYSGLNHRGFLYNFSAAGRSLHADIVRALPSRILPDVTREDVGMLQAVPLKYFSVIRAPRLTPRRASVLRDLRASLLGELAADPTRSPASLGKRNLDWYPRAIVPLLIALSAPDDHVAVVNIMGSDDVVIETKARIRSGSVTPVEASLPSAAVQLWTGRFLAHERAVLAATLESSPRAIAGALRLDPLVGAEHVDALTRELIESVENS
jgi:6-phospho-beta-glucosidase